MRIQISLYVKPQVNTFSDKGLTVNILGILVHIVTDIIMQFCWRSTNAARETEKYINEHGYVPIKIYLQKHCRCWPTDTSLPTLYKVILCQLHQVASLTLHWSSLHSYFSYCTFKKLKKKFSIDLLTNTKQWLEKVWTLHS